MNKIAFISFFFWHENLSFVRPLKPFSLSVENKELHQLFPADLANMLAPSSKDMKILLVSGILAREWKDGVTWGSGHIQSSKKAVGGAETGGQPRVARPNFVAHVGVSWPATVMSFMDQCILIIPVYTYCNVSLRFCLRFNKDCILGDTFSDLPMGLWLSLCSPENISWGKIEVLLLF